MDPKKSPADTPWSSVAQKISDNMWDRLAEMPPEDLKALVAEAVEKARLILEIHRSTFDDHVCEETMSRIIGSYGVRPRRFGVGTPGVKLAPDFDDPLGEFELDGDPL